MELFIITFTLLLTLPLTFSFFLKFAIYCLSFYLKRKYSIIVSVAKCGLTSFRTIVIKVPLRSPLSTSAGRDGLSAGEIPSLIDDDTQERLISITIDLLRLSSSHLDNSCKAPLSVHLSNVTIQTPSEQGSSQLPIRIGSLDFPMDKIRGDFLRHYKENFSVLVNDIVVVMENFSYRIEKLSIIKSTSLQKNDMMFDLSRVIFSDLSIPEIKQFSSELPEELTNQRILFVEQVQISYIVGHSRSLNMTISGDFFLQWNLEFHLNIINLINVFKRQLKKPVKDENVDPRPTSSSQAPLSLKLNLEGRLSVGASISDEQTVCINTESLDINGSFPGPKSMSSKLVRIHFDEHTIATCSMASLSHYPSPGISCMLDRNQNSCGMKLSDPSNSLLCVEVDKVDVAFPYKYDFADAFNEKLLAIIKWIKRFHKKVPTNRDLPPIDPDINVKINHFSFKLENDPFEMKLRNNYMLLKDEYHEQLKREQTLQDKLSELKRTNLMLASSIVEELSRALAVKNSDIYIQRSRQLHASERKHSPLFHVVIEDADFKIIADSSFHKHEDIKKIIESINPGCPMASDISFTTIWCRVVSADFKRAEIFLLDFPIPMLSIKDSTIKGLVLGTEQVAVPRARRDCQVYMGRTKEPSSVERSMMPLKIFNNLQWRCSTANYTHGPCWDPVLSQVSISFEDVISASSDPSPPLPWWDKMRFIIHGQCKLHCNQLSVVLHASNDPYNQTELIELTLSRSMIDWNGDKIRIKGDFDALLHTASKYDECRFIHLPNLEMTVISEWLCLGNPNDHHSIMPCAPDKVPDYSSHHNHDSYRSFRSQNLNLTLNIETQYTSPTISLNPENMPSMLIFGSTIRWLENQKFIFVGPSKLTRRGVLFNNTRPRKQPFSRLFNDVKFNVSLNRIQILYWSSVSKRHGIQVVGGDLVHKSEHNLKLTSNSSDGLIHRPQADWQTVCMNTDLSNVDIWLYNLTYDDLDEFNEFNVQTNLKNRQYFISFSRISYSRVAQAKRFNEYEMAEENDGTVDPLGSDINSSLEDEQVPHHKLIIHDLKAAWTKDNRDVVIGIFDAFVNSLQLKRNLSTEALKPIRIESQSVQPPLSQTGSTPYRHQRHPSTTSLLNANIIPNTVSSVSKNRAVSMLQKLIADSENNPTVYTEESHSGVASETHLYGVEACQMEDVVDVNCLIELVNSQVVLRGTETHGYVIVSAAHTEVRQATHLPVWKNRTLLSKTSWTGSLKCMQYYATVDGHAQASHSRRIFTDKSEIQWLDPDNIDYRSIVTDYPDMVGSGQSVGGVVSSVVGKLGHSDESAEEESPIQLQRIISRCNCLFYYASHTAGISENLQHLIPPLPDDEMFIEPWDKEVGVDSFSLTHQDLEISTNSQQYAMIMDIINNLLLFVEPHKKTAFEELERMRFRFQFSADEDQRVPISQLQDQVRKYVAYLKRLERERYLVYRASIDDSMILEPDHDYRLSLDTLSCEIQSVKEQLNSASEELAMMISCYKEMQLGAHKAQKQQAATQEGIGAFFANVIKRNEICFQSARWRVTDSDGQLGLADIVLNNFLYSKVVKSDDSVEHTIELGHLMVNNLIPNQAYKDVLHPTELQANIPLDRQRALRVYCRELAPVGGISVKEHLELNVVPFTIQITLQFFQKMVRFFFPEKDSIREEKSKRSGLDLSGEHQLSRFGSKRRGEEIEKMRERASKNHLFVYVKIPGIPIKVSYKGKKHKNVTDLKNVSLTLPTSEYHNSTWTWLDLLMAVKNDSKHTVIKQALKHKMKIRPSAIWSKSSNNQEQQAQLGVVESSGKEGKTPVPVTDEDKARLLLGPYAKRWRADPPLDVTPKLQQQPTTWQTESISSSDSSPKSLLLSSTNSNQSPDI